MKEELQRVVQMSQEFLTPKSKALKSLDSESEAGSGSASSSTTTVKIKAYLSVDIGARRSSKKRLSRGRDSGMGLLDEDEEECF
jgi:hypothetical protein